MRDIDQISRGFSELKEKYVEHNTRRFQNLTAIQDKDRATRSESYKLVSEIRVKLDEYCKKHFDALSARIGALEDILIKECGKIPAGQILPPESPAEDDEKTFVADGAENNSEYDSKQRRLRYMLECINGGIAELNALDFDKIVPPLTFVTKGEETLAQLESGETVFKFTASNATKHQRNTTVKEVAQIVGRIIPCCKEARKVIEDMKRIYIRRFNADGFAAALNNRVSELNAQRMAEFQDSKLDFFNSYFGEALMGSSLGNFLDKIELENKMRGKVTLDSSVLSPGVVTLGRAWGKIFSQDAGLKEYADRAPSRSRFIYLGENPSVTVEMDFSDKGNLLLDLSESPYSKLTVGFVDQYIYQFLTAFGVSRSHICLIDVDRMLGLASLKELEQSYPEILYKGFVRDDRLLEDTVRDIEQQMYDNADALEGKGGFIECVSRDRDQAPDAYLLVLVNFPAGCRPEVARRISSIMSNGARSGIFTLLINNRYRGLEYGFTPAEYGQFMKQAKASSLTIVKRSGETSYSFGKAEGVSFLPFCSEKNADPDVLKKLLK